MMSPKKRLGRGLDALLTKPVSSTASVTGDTPAEGEQLRYIPVELLQRGQYQPRVDMRQDSLQELADSIKVQGVVQPIVARPIGNRDGAQRYEIVAGERRWRAAQLAGLAEIPAVVRDVPDESAIAMALIENIQRENLNPLEESVALQRLIDEFEMTHQEVADTVARSRAAVSNLLRLQELNNDVKALLEDRTIEMGHARALLGVSGITQSKLAKETARKGLSVRETEQLVRKTLNPPKKAPKPVKDADIRQLENSLSEKLGAAVNIHQKTKAKGRLEISYNSLDELEGILSRIQ